MNDSNAAPSARLRASEVLAREQRALAIQGGAAVGFHQGADDTLSWLMAGGACPLTGELVGLPIPAAAIVRELAAAEAVLARSPSRCGRYAAGVLHTLMWAQSVTPEPPHSAAMAVRRAVVPT